MFRVFRFFRFFWFWVFLVVERSVVFLGFRFVFLFWILSEILGGYVSPLPFAS